MKKFLVVGFLLLVFVGVSAELLVRLGPLDVVAVYFNSRSLQLFKLEETKEVYWQQFRSFVSSVFHIGVGEDKTRVGQICGDNDTDGNYNFSQGTNGHFVRTHQCALNVGQQLRMLNEVEKMIQNKTDDRKHDPNLLAVIFDGRFDSHDVKTLRQLSTALNTTKIMFFHTTDKQLMNKPTVKFMHEIARNEDDVIHFNVMNMEETVTNFYEAICEFKKLNSVCQTTVVDGVEKCGRKVDGIAFPYSACKDVPCECPVVECDEKDCIQSLRRGQVAHEIL